MEYTEYELKEIEIIKANTSSMIDICVSQIKGNILKTIRQRWLEGESVNGGNITNKSTGKGYASKAYEKIKKQKNPKAGGNVDLTLTGSLGKNLVIIKQNDGDYNIISTDSKYLKLANKYGFEEFGLSKDETIFYMSQLDNLIEEKLKNL